MSQSELLLLAVHAQLLGFVLSVIDPEDPPGGTLAEDWLSEYVQAPALCVTVNVSPATVMIPERSTVNGFAATV